ncbi:hypothetical protein H8959_013108 [Pygathrix nigripes]
MASCTSVIILRRREGLSRAGWRTPRPRKDPSLPHGPATATAGLALRLGSDAASERARGRRPGPELRSASTGPNQPLPAGGAVGTASLAPPSRWLRAAPYAREGGGATGAAAVGGPAVGGGAGPRTRAWARQCTDGRSWRGSGNGERSRGGRLPGAEEWAGARVQRRGRRDTPTPFRPRPSVLLSTLRFPARPGPAQPGASFGPCPQCPLPGSGGGDRSGRRCRMGTGLGLPGAPFSGASLCDPHATK